MPSVLDELKTLFRTADEAVAQVRARHGAEVRCRKGCADCCHAVFDVSPVEAACLLAHFDALDRGSRRTALARAEKAMAAWNRLVRDGDDLSRARIRCPLLTRRDECLCYAARPINCRTYGVPTVIGGRSHVCGHSGFRPGVTYTTLALAPLQARLRELSAAVVGPQKAAARRPVAAVLLDGRDLPDLF